MRVDYALKLINIWKDQNDWPEDYGKQTPIQQVMNCLAEEVEALRMVELINRAETAEKRVQQLEASINAAASCLEKD